MKKTEFPGFQVRFPQKKSYIYVKNPISAEKMVFPIKKSYCSRISQFEMEKSIFPQLPTCNSRCPLAEA